MHIEHDNILFFESHHDPQVAHNLMLYTDKNNIVFRGKLKETLGLGPEFFSCHHSIVVNLKKIKHVDRKEKEVILYNGDILPVSKRKLPELLKAWETYLQSAG